MTAIEGGLGWLNKDAIKYAMMQHGKVLQVFIPNGKKFAYVSFESGAAMEDVIRKRDFEFEGCKVRVDFDVSQASGGEHIGDSACLGVTAFDGEEAAGAEAGERERSDAWIERIAGIGGVKGKLRLPIPDFDVKCFDVIRVDIRRVCRDDIKCFFGGDIRVKVTNDELTSLKDAMELSVLPCDCDGIR